MTKEYDVLFDVTHFYSGEDFYVAQKEKYGCALACMAMILNTSYEEIKALWDSKYGANEGIASFQQMSFLFTKGFVGYEKYSTEGWTQREREPNEWIKPFAQVHIVSVITLNGPHALVWLPDGRVFDPNVRGVHSIDTYNVQSITGYWALANGG